MVKDVASSRLRASFIAKNKPTTTDNKISISPVATGLADLINLLLYPYRQLNIKAVANSW